VSNEKSPHAKISDERMLEIYHKILERKEKYNVPYVLSLHGFGIRSWTSFKKRIKEIKGKDFVDLIKKEEYIGRREQCKKVQNTTY